MTDKEIDLKIHNLLGLETKYEVRAGFLIIEKDLTLEKAQSIVKEEKGQYGSYELSITSTRPLLYHFDLEYAVRAAEKLAKKYDFTFVLTYNQNEQWRAAFGDYKNCEEVEHEDPAMATCLAVIKFMETL